MLKAFWVKGGGGILKQNEIRKFHLSYDTCHTLGVLRSQAQKEYGKALEMKGTYIRNILALLFF